MGGCDAMLMTKSKQCEKCGKDFYPKKQAKKRRFCYDCFPEEDASRNLVRQKIKQWSLEYKGTKCSKCGYNKCTAALDFHHINMEEKEFSLSDRELKFDWPAIKKELDKCIVLCANCHREEHNPNLFL